MFDADIQVTNPQLFAAYADALEQAPELTHQVIDREVNSVGEEVLAHLRTEPGAVRYPIEWHSVRQRKAYFATNGFGHGIPYQRTHQLAQGWKMQIVYGSDEITSIVIGNDAPERPFVTGQYQQIFHLNTGWPEEELLLDESGHKLDDAVETGLLRVMYAIDALAETRMGQ